MNLIPKTYTPTEVALLLGVKTSTVYAMLSRGEIQGYHQGRRRLITEEQLGRYRASKRVEVVDRTYAFGSALQLSR
jgi:hypothetical protein